MSATIETFAMMDDAAAIRKALEASGKFHQCRNRQQMLEEVLKQLRGLTAAQAGSLFMVEGDQLRFVAVQNDVLDTSEIARHLLGQVMPISEKSLAGFVALTGEVMNIPDIDRLAGGAPFRINRDFDTRTGYRVRSILAIPLKCPDGHCIGVLELFNRQDGSGQAQPFPKDLSAAAKSLATTAAVMLHNTGLQIKLREAHLSTIFRLATIGEYRDADTGNHVQRVSRTSELVAQSVGLDEGQVNLIKCASPMHDVGKVAIPDAILLKPGHLTAHQRNVMERHTIVGGAIFANPEDSVIATARDIALNHHERWDGLGYPGELKGESTPISGRIVAIADVFDAVVSRRCYKEACSLDVALAILDEDSGKHFDPAVVKAFLAVLDPVLESYPDLKAA
jgi:HD-GYP domain-containing protein (c-di-GMP phosphodiesterase class II)